MIRFLIIVGLCVGLAVCGATVKLGKRTFFGHVKAIWSTEEARDMREGIQEKAGPVVDKIERGAKAGWKEATKGEPSGSGSGSAARPEAPAVTP